MIQRSIINTSTSSVRPRAHDWYDTIRLTHHSINWFGVKFRVFHKRNWSQMVWYIMSLYPGASPQIARQLKSIETLRLAITLVRPARFTGSNMADRLQYPTCVSMIPVLKLEQFDIPAACENWLGLVNICIYSDRQTRGIYLILPYIDFPFKLKVKVKRIFISENTPYPQIIINTGSNIITLQRYETHKLKQGLFVQLWSTWTLVIYFQILSLGNTWRDNIVSFDKDSWQSGNDTQNWSKPTLASQVCLAKHLSAHSTEVLSHAHHISSGGNFKQHLIFFTDYQVELYPHQANLVPVVYFYQCSVPARDWNWHGFFCLQISLDTDSWQLILFLLITHVKNEQKNEGNQKNKERKTKYAFLMHRRWCQVTKPQFHLFISTFQLHHSLPLILIQWSNFVAVAVWIYQGMVTASQVLG